MQQLLHLQLRCADASCLQQNYQKWVSTCSTPGGFMPPDSACAPATRLADLCGMLSLLSSSSLLLLPLLINLQSTLESGLFLLCLCKIRGPDNTLCVRSAVININRQKFSVDANTDVCGQHLFTAFSRLKHASRSHFCWLHFPINFERVCSEWQEIRASISCSTCSDH